MTVSPTPVCTVCIANYNGESLLIDCIDSVLNQQCDFLVEIIVHDDASTDQSLELLATRYPQVKVITSKTNVGFCISNNRMTKEAAGQFILLLNNDAALAPDALATLHEHAMKQATQGILSLPQYDWESGNLVDRGCLLDFFYNPVPNMDPARQEVAMVIGACLWIPRKVWLNLAGFPEWFESIAEDMYICCLARLQGITVEVTGSSSYRHRQGKSFGGNRSSDGQLNSTLRRRKLSERNKTFVLAVCTPFPLQTTAILLHLLALLIEGAFISLLSRKPYLFSDIYLAAIIDLFKNIKTISAERTRIYRERLCSTSKFFRHFTVVPQKIRLLKKYGIPRVN